MAKLPKEIKYKVRAKDIKAVEKIKETIEDAINTTARAMQGMQISLKEAKQACGTLSEAFSDLKELDITVDWVEAPTSNSQ